MFHSQRNVSVVACGPGNQQALALLDSSLGLLLDHSGIQTVQCDGLDSKCQYQVPESTYGGDPDVYAKFSTKFSTEKEGS